MNLVVPTANLATQMFIKTIPVRVVGMALGCCLCEKIAQIINKNFSIRSVCLPYAGLIIGALVTTPQTIVICAIALLVLKSLASNKKAAVKIPCYMENMKETVGSKERGYVPLEKETEQIAVFINNDEKSNVMIIGPPGSGKTALIEGIVQRNYENDSTLPRGLRDKIFYRVSCLDLMKDTEYRGSLEKKINKILEFAKNQKNSVVIFDEIHQLAAANRGNRETNNVSVLDFFKADLTGSGISIIGITTDNEFKTISHDRALVRRFNLIQLRSPSFWDSLQMLKKRTESLLNKYQTITIKDHTVYTKVLRLAEKPLCQNSSLIDQGYNILQTAFTAIRLEGSSEMIEIDQERINEIYRKYFMTSEDSEELELDIL